MYNPSLSRAKTDIPARTRPFRRIPQKLLLRFTRSLAIMLEARLSLVDALETTITASSHKGLTDILNHLCGHIKRGHSLADGLSRYPKLFSPLFVNLVRAGEAAGILDQVLLRLADHLEKTSRVKRKIQMALAYPVLVLLIAGAVIGFFLVYIVPTFADMFATFDAELPLPTLILIRTSTFLTTHALSIFVMVLCTGILIVTGLDTPRGRFIWHRSLLKLPVLGPLILQRELAHFCNTLGTLLSSGINLIEALNYLTQITHNAALKQDIETLTGQIRKGNSLNRGLQQSPLFPPIMIQMIAVGEQTAHLDRMLIYVGQHFESEIDSFLTGLTSIIEPILIALIGFVIGGILLAMYLPLFEFLNVIG